MMKVKVMRPIFKPEEPANFILYPYYVFHLKLFYKRIGREDKEFDYFAYVDCYRFGVERGDGFIEIQEWNVREDQIMEELVNKEKAREKALESAFQWGNLRVISWWTPRIEMIKEEKVYKVFWIFEEEGEKYIMDSLTGDKFKLKDLT
ncbi:hypothetical protein PAP_05555 [Palaeococcus pacificus DY20341]|uniref:Uncharacterized protein n=1 Tax=Palaeococcus pacificus DY20341 TaxID=1343739 RepID=A0A075LT81_9EURY|nr:hypothetical protein [Palaeococcus pacificus]AIF69514.1 hypothetical protein PAP_05555 [Palaeococcus pacificus DY20341]